MKEGGGRDILLDLSDVKIFNIIDTTGKIRITDLRKKIGLTHANLLTHLRRISPYLIRKRDKQSIYLSLNGIGKTMNASFKKVYPQIRHMFKKGRVIAAIRPTKEDKLRRV